MVLYVSYYLHKTETNLKFKIKQQNSDAALRPGMGWDWGGYKRRSGALCMFGGRVDVQVGRF